MEYFSVPIIVIIGIIFSIWAVLWFFVPFHINTIVSRLNKIVEILEEKQNSA